ncbi:antitoxin HicB [Azospirillaceae bacterium]
MLAYYVTAEATEEGWTVRARDLPELITFVDHPEAIADQAADALVEALAARIADREEIPPPSAGLPGELLVAVPSQAAVKALLWQALKARGWRRADMARALNCTQSQVDRLLSLRHASRYDQVDAALSALGKRLTVGIADAA